jgi:hypothetical protein
MVASACLAIDARRVDPAVLIAKRAGTDILRRMTRTLAKFDGKQIEVPPELLVNAEPQTVVIQYEPKAKRGVGKLTDLIGHNPNPKSDDEIDEQLARERREGW